MPRFVMRRTAMQRRSVSFRRPCLATVGGRRKKEGVAQRYPFLPPAEHITHSYTPPNPPLLQQTPPRWNPTKPTPNPTCGAPPHAPARVYPCTNNKLNYVLPRHRSQNIRSIAFQLDHNNFNLLHSFRRDDTQVYLGSLPARTSFLSTPRPYYYYSGF